MKSLKILVALFIMGACSFTFTNCGDKEAEKNVLADSLKNVNGVLAGQLNEKQAALQEFIESFNEIQENLNVIKEKEKIVTSVSSSKSDVKSKQGQIQEDIQSIYDLMAKNKNRISA